MWRMKLGIWSWAWNWFQRTPGPLDTIFLFRCLSPFKVVLENFYGGWCCMCPRRLRVSFLFGCLFPFNILYSKFSYKEEDVTCVPEDSESPWCSIRGCRPIQGPTLHLIPCNPTQLNGRFHRGQTFNIPGTPVWTCIPFQHLVSSQSYKHNCMTNAWTKIWCGTLREWPTFWVAHLLVFWRFWRRKNPLSPSEP